MRATLNETVTAEYVDTPPPSDAFRFTLYKEVDGQWQRDGYESDCTLEAPHTEFEIVRSGKYKVTCQRLNIYDQKMGPIAESEPAYVGSAGQYQAPLRVTFSLAPPDDESV